MVEVLGKAYVFCNARLDGNRLTIVLEDQPLHMVHNKRCVQTAFYNLFPLSFKMISHCSSSV